MSKDNLCGGERMDEARAARLRREKDVQSAMKAEVKRLRAEVERLERERWEAEGGNGSTR